MKTAQDSYTITIKQIVRFQERMHLEKFQVDKINLFTSRPKCIPGSRDPGITIVNPTEIPVMYGYIH